MTTVPRCICFAGVDGSGKSTQVRALAAAFASEGKRVRIEWLRFPRLTCAPLLAFARWRGYSLRERVDGHDHGYWNFRRSWIMRAVFPYLLLLDTAIVTALRVHVPLARGATVIADRCALDTLVDLMAGLGTEDYDERFPGRLFFALLPGDSMLVTLDLDTATCWQRSPELCGDRTHTRRRELYLDVAQRHGIPIVSTLQAPDVVARQIMELIREHDRMPSLALG